MKKIGKIVLIVVLNVIGYVLIEKMLKRAFGMNSWEMKEAQEQKEFERRLAKAQNK